MSLEAMINEHNTFHDLLTKYSKEIKTMISNDMDDSENYNKLVSKWTEAENQLLRSKARLYKSLLEESFEPSTQKEWVEKVYKQIK